jgi:N-acetylglucosamine-6-phosphate deacetylase
MRTVLSADSLWTGSKLIPYPVVEIEGNRIVAITEGFGAHVEVPGAEVHNFKGAMLAPAFFDVHIHGAAGHDVMEATPEALGAIGKFLATRGTGCYLATTVTAPLEMTLRALDGLAKLIDHPDRIAEGDAALPVGIHLEGPFLSHEKCGVQPKEYLLKPDIATFDRLYEASGGHARLMTLAPELTGASELAAHATAKGVRVSVGHSNATAAETRAAIAAGAVSATHTFNAMRQLDHREPGILGVVLSTDSLYAELVCDGIHTAPEIVKIWWRSKGPERGILITDAMSAAGMPDGEYHLGDFAVHVSNGRATARGVLAGSVLTLDRALQNFIAFTGATVDQALRLLTVNPAAMTGFCNEAGTIAVGRKANLVAVDATGKLAASIHNGELVGAVAAH